MHLIFSQYQPITNLTRKADCPESLANTDRNKKTNINDKGRYFSVTVQARYDH